MATGTSKEPLAKTSKMKLLAVGSFFILVAAIIASQVKLLFLNSTEFTVNEIPPEVRLYWMRQANQALYNYSGPWYCYLPRVAAL